MSVKNEALQWRIKNATAGILKNSVIHVSFYWPRPFDTASCYDREIETWTTEILRIPPIQHWNEVSMTSRYKKHERASYSFELFPEELSYVQNVQRSWNEKFVFLTRCLPPRTQRGQIVRILRFLSLPRSNGLFINNSAYFRNPDRQ